MASLAGERGQAAVEAIAGIAVLLLGAAICLQLLAAGHALTLADGAAEAGAMALAAGLDPEKAAREAVPGWAASRVEVRREGGRVEVALTPPALLSPLADALEVSSSAWVRRP